MINQFVRKRCQKKRKDVEYFVVHEQSAVKNSFSTYVCYAPEGLFWLNLYFNDIWFIQVMKNVIVVCPTSTVQILAVMLPIFPEKTSPGTEQPYPAGDIEVQYVYSHSGNERACTVYYFNFLRPDFELTSCKNAYKTSIISMKVPKIIIL